MAILSSYVTQTAHSPTAVFARWADPETWPEWDREVRAVSFEGPARLGARGRIRPASGPSTSFSIMALEADRVLTNASSVPGAKLVFEHIVRPTVEGAEISVTVRIDGPLAALWKRVVGRSLAGAAQSSVTGLLAHLDAA